MNSELSAIGCDRPQERLQHSARAPRAQIVRLSDTGKLSLNSHCRIHNCSGFTLIELLVVISLISILAAMGMVQYRNQVRRTQESVLKTDLFHMRDAIDQYYADKGKYPASLDALVSDGYLRKIPDDPITLSASTWQTVPAEPDPANPSAEPGIYDVKSGATGTALDGSNYADW